VRRSPLSCEATTSMTMSDQTENKICSTQRVSSHGYRTLAVRESQDDIERRHADHACENKAAIPMMSNARGHSPPKLAGSVRQPARVE